MKKTNIIITSAGKRVTLVRMFQKELKSVYPESKIYTTDMNPAMAPAGIISDGCFPVPRVTDANYINELIQICETHQIALIIPTIVAAHDITAIVSDFDFVASCRDKRCTIDLMNSLHIRIPELRDKHHPIFPLFAKPYDGSLSKDLYVIHSKEELTPEIMEHPKLIFMEYIDKKIYKEFTVDMYYGKDHQVKCIVPRERVEIRAGEINKGFTRKNYLVNYLKERMGYLPGVIGCICIQLFYRESDNDVVGIEINPRFGGGYPLSYHAKANFQQYLIQEYLQENTIDYFEGWLDNTLMLRYDSEVVVYEK